jgi:hypothetical protein
VRLIALRSGRVLAVGSGAVGGPLPSLEEARRHVTIAGVHELSGRDVCLAETVVGEPPDEWRWLSPSELQSELSPEDADAVGEALLCV